MYVVAFVYSCLLYQYSPQDIKILGWYSAGPVLRHVEKVHL